MLRIYRIDHVATVAPDLEKQVGLLKACSASAARMPGTTRRRACRGCACRCRAPPGTPGWLLAPSGSDSAVAAWLDDHGGRPGLHHVGAEVPDLDAAVAVLEGARAEDHRLGGRGAGWRHRCPRTEHGPGVLWRLRGPGDLHMLGDEGAQPVSAPEPSGPALGIRNIDHICQAFHDRDELADWYTELAGFVQVWRTADDEIPGHGRPGAEHPGLQHLLGGDHRARRGLVSSTSSWRAAGRPRTTSPSRSPTGTPRWPPAPPTRCRPSTTRTA